jgi:hypothetical protein
MRLPAGRPLASASGARRQVLVALAALIQVPVRFGHASSGRHARPTVRGR